MRSCIELEIILKKEYLLAFKIGKTMVKYETAENIFKKVYPEKYKSEKRKIRWLSECEIRELLDELFEVSYK